MITPCVVNVEEGDYRVEASLEGYETQVQLVSLDGTDTTLHFDMVESSDAPAAAGALTWVLGAAVCGVVLLLLFRR